MPTRVASVDAHGGGWRRVSCAVKRGRCKCVGVKVAAAAAGTAGKPWVVDGQGEARRYTPRAHHASLYDAAYQPPPRRERK
jgi:hypothetical protein